MKTQNNNEELYHNLFCVAS